MKQVAVGAAIAFGWHQFVRRPWYLIGVSLSVCALFILMSGNGAVMTALGSIVYAGYLAFLISYSKNDEVSFDELFVVDKRWIYFAFLVLIKSLLIFLGIILFVVPGVYLMLRFMFAELLVVDKGLAPVAALRASSEMTAGIKWKLLWFSIVSLAVLVLGLALFVVGAIPASIILSLAFIKLYRDLNA